MSLPGTEESTPFDETTLVFKVGGKIFAAADMERFDAFVVKCDPDEAVALRDAHAEITEAYHWNKRWWNAVSVTGDLPESFLRGQILQSYMLVVRRNVTPKSLRESLLSYFMPASAGEEKRRSRSLFHSPSAES